jgi:hypothetical protein
VYVKPERRETSKRLLNMDWDFAVYVDPVEEAARKAGTTFAKAKQVALARVKAFEVLAGDDPRPLLVMRECGWCEGSDDALLSANLDNEKTVLLSTWFHTVKLPNHVLESDHSFRKLFDDNSPAHLFVANMNGDGMVHLDGQQSQSQLWDAMLGILDESYEGDAERTIRNIEKVLDKIDMADEQTELLQSRFEDVLESKGPRSSKFKKAKKDLDRAVAKKKELEGEIDNLKGSLPLVPEQAPR